MFQDTNKQSAVVCHVDVAQQPARIIRDRSSPKKIAAFVAAIDREARQLRATHATVISSCAYVLARTITAAKPDDAAAIRSGILALMDGFAMQGALNRPES